MKAFRRAIAAFAARSAFMRPMRKSRPPGLWRALGLQWRAKLRPQASARVSAARPAIASPWMTSIHLRLTCLHQTHQILEGRTKAFAGAPQGMLPKAACAAHDWRRHAPAATATPPGRSTLTLFATGALVAGARRGPAAMQRALPSPRRGHTAAPGLIELAIAARASSPQPAWKATAAQARRAPLRAATGRVVAEAPSLAASALMPQAGAPALVWRKAGAALLAHGMEAHAAAAQLVFAGAAEAPHPASASTPAPAAPTAAAHLAPLRRQLTATALDPALTDRLADEVMRRVERSMRIERERRGR